MKGYDRQKVVVIGLDGATFDIILPMVQKGKLPNISRLINKGAFSVCPSVINCNSATAWTTITTGKNPGKHGIPHFFGLQPRNYSVRFMNASFRKAKPIWSLLSRDRKVIVINVPFTYPPDKVNGILLSGLYAPDLKSDFVYPQQILGEIEKQFGDYVIEYPAYGSLNYKRATGILRNIRSIEEKRKDIALYLIKKYPWDFFMIVFTALDRMGHFFWHCMDKRHPRYNEEGAEAYRDAIFTAYEDMDHIVGDILNNIDEDVSVILASDHGMGPLDLDNTLLLDKWLCENGLMKFKDRRSKISSSYHERIEIIMRKYLSPTIKRYLRSFFSAQRERFISQVTLKGIDWAQTKVYPMPSVSLSCSTNLIWINLEGREPQGIVKPGKEYEDLRDLLKDKLSNLKSPTGKKLIKAVYRKEEVYHGKYVDRFPDVVIEFAEEAFFPEICKSTRGNVASSDIISISGAHRRDGIFIAKGPDIHKGKVLGDVGVADLAPTILHLMGEGVPLSMDGRVLEEIFTERFRDKSPIRYIKDEEISHEREQLLYSEKESQVIEERLRSLGYL